MSETIEISTGVGKPWQKGFSLDYLRGIAARFREHDGDRCLGAFSAVKENVVASWLADGRLVVTPDAVVAARFSRSAQTVQDWRGLDAVRTLAGTLTIERAAGSGAAIAEVVERLAAGSPIIWRSWADHPAEAHAAQSLGLHRVGTLIRASSEILAVRARGVQSIGSAEDSEDRAGIIPLPIYSSSAELAQAQTWLSEVDRLWTDHYSSYNKRHTWSAVALRSFGGDPVFIEKPAEMSRRYREEHPERLGWPVADTPLMDLPGARSLLQQLAAPLERVRLMRLTGGGELSRHADITDRDAGTAVGRVARLHLPIRTHESVRFTSWDLSNSPRTVHMEPGRWWYLDVRKPHRAVNDSGVERVHLVADCIVTPSLLSVLRSAAAEAGA